MTPPLSQSLSKGANGSKNRQHDAYPVPGYYERCSERVRICQLKKYRQPKNWLTLSRVSEERGAEEGRRWPLVTPLYYTQA